MRKMNANELTQILEIGGAWEDDSGNLHNVPTGEFEQALSEAIAIIERTRIRNTATEPPTKEDAGRFDGMTGMVLARTWRGRSIVKDWEIVERDPAMYPQRTCVPEFEGGKA